jgi:hypothetical protein
MFDMSNKVTQKVAVFNAIVEVLEKNGNTYTEGMDIHPFMSKEIRSEVNDILCEGFTNGTIGLSEEASAKYNTPALLRGYGAGLISNWVRKDLRVNGNVPYSAKNPGSRRGASDPQMKALKTLLNSTTDVTEREEIQSYIDTRLTQLEAGKKKSTPVDFSVLPAELAAKFAKN